MIICYTVPEIWHVTDAILAFNFGLFFALLTPLTAEKNQNFEKMKKTPRDIIILHMCTKSYDQIWCTTDRQTNRQMERQTDRWKK